MAALAAKIPTADLRMEIVRNVWEEHGEGQETKFHGTSFLMLLERLSGVTSADVQKRALWPEIRIFNTTLSGACVLDEYLVGGAMMGMIERMFWEISAWIGQSIVNRGWLSKEKMCHYNLHEDLDIKHADDFFNVLKLRWDGDPTSRYYIEQGLRLGATVFNGLYEGLYRNSSRRIMRDVTGPHTRAGG